MTQISIFQIRIRTFPLELYFFLYGPPAVRLVSPCPLCPQIESVATDLEEVRSGGKYQFCLVAVDKAPELSISSFKLKLPFLW